MASALDKLTLAEIGSPQPIEVVGFELAPEDENRLKVLGICERRKLFLVQVGSPMVIEVYGSCIGISRKLAEGILVVPK